MCVWGGERDSNNIYIDKLTSNECKQILMIILVEKFIKPIAFFLMPQKNSKKSYKTIPSEPE